MHIAQGGRVLREWTVPSTGVSDFLLWEIGDECGVHEFLCVIGGPRHCVV
jgi:hypothetical protein